MMINNIFKRTIIMLIVFFASILLILLRHKKDLSRHSSKNNNEYIIKLYENSSLIPTQGTISTIDPNHKSSKCSPRKTEYLRNLDSPHIISGNLDTTSLRDRRYAYGFTVHNINPVSDSSLSSIERLTLVAMRSIRKTGSKQDIIILHINTHTSEFLKLSKKLINVKFIDATKYAKYLAKEIGQCPKHAITNSKGCKKVGWTNLDSCWNRYIFWTLNHYTKIIYMDGDTLVLKNIDHLFSYPALSASVDTFYALNKHPSVFNAGIMVLEPNLKDFQGLVTYAATNEIWKNEYGALNEYFANCWNVLPLAYNLPALLTTSIFSSKQRGSKVENAFIIHFVGSSKPTGVNIKGKQTDPIDYIGADFLEIWRQIDSS